MVERLHRQLKTSLKAHLCGPNWMDELPLVLLGIRTVWREDAGCSAADLDYGTGLHVPGEFFPPTEAGPPNLDPPTEFLHHLQDMMCTTLPPPPEFHGNHPTYIPHNLAATGFIYVRQDAHCGPLQRPYNGPFKILETAEKHFILDVNGCRNAVSVDRLKTAYGHKDSLGPLTQPQPRPVPPATSPTLTDVGTPPPTSRSGRPIRPPQRYS